MKKLMITCMLTALCWSAFALEMPQQDPARKQQDTTKKHPAKPKMGKKKHPAKKSTGKMDTLKHKPVDTTKMTPPM